MNNIVLSGNSISFHTDLKYLHDINFSDYSICLFVCLFVCLYALIDFSGYYCIYVYIEGLMED